MVSRPDFADLESDSNSETEIVWTVKINSSDWKKYTCTCPSFYKNYNCKHICEIAIIGGLFTVSPEAKNIPIGKKRKRGRPVVARTALIVQYLVINKYYT